MLMKQSWKHLQLTLKNSIGVQNSETNTTCHYNNGAHKSQIQAMCKQAHQYF